MDLFEHDIDEEAQTLEIKINAAKFDAGVCSDFARYVDDLITEEWEAIVLDVSTVTFIDSSGVGALLSIQKAWNQPNRSILLKGVTPTVRSIIELLRLQRVFTLQSA